MDEFVPFDYLARSLRLWWVIALATVLGGLGGFLFHFARAPIYEATATFFVTLDFNQVPPGTLSQYDEDLALSVVQKVLQQTPALHQQIASRAEFQATGMDYATWMKSISLEREHAFWRLRFRHTDPQVAQELVNLWAELGYQALLETRQANQFASYVVFEPPVLAALPVAPRNYGRNQMVFAGSMLGFIVGLTASDLIARRPERRRSQPTTGSA